MIRGISVSGEVASGKRLHQKNWKITVFFMGKTTSININQHQSTISIAIFNIFFYVYRGSSWIHGFFGWIFFTSDGRPGFSAWTGTHPRRTLRKPTRSRSEGETMWIELQLDMLFYICLSIYGNTMTY